MTLDRPPVHPASLAPTPARTALVLFARTGADPKPLGLGPDSHRRLDRGLLCSTLRTLGRFHDRARLVLALDEQPDAELTAQLGGDATVLVQRGRGFGPRLLDALDRTRRLGFDRLVVVGSDAPSLSPRDVEAALSARGEVVLGPAVDGGIYLLGFDAADLPLLDALPWRTPTLFDALVRRLDAHGRARRLLTRRRDVDDGWDVAALRRLLEALCGPLGRARPLADLPRLTLARHATPHDAGARLTHHLARPPPVALGP